MHNSKVDNFYKSTTINLSRRMSPQIFLLHLLWLICSFFSILDLAVSLYADIWHKSWKFETIIILPGQNNCFHSIKSTKYDFISSVSCLQINLKNI